MIPELSPIKLPTLNKLQMSDKNNCHKESFQAAMMIFSEGEFPTGQSFWIDDEQTIWIWEAEQDRLWLLGHSHASVNYFSFETGHPFLWRSESLLKKSRIESFRFEIVQFHLAIRVDYWIPPSNDVLEEKDGLPLIAWEMEKKKLLPASSRKFIRSFYQQLKFASLGFKEPDRTRTELLSLLVQTTCKTTIATVQKIHTEIWKEICVKSEVINSEKKRIYQEEGGTESKSLINEEWLFPEKLPYQITKKETEPSLNQESQTKS